jgi:Cu-Zn family superoxide dismutase
MNFVRKTFQTLVMVGLLSFLFLTQSALASPTAQVIITSTDDPSEVLGEVDFAEGLTGLVINATFQDVPAGKHGFHIHEYGSCTDAGKGAGGHYNPERVKHGYLPEDGFKNAHAGDFGNVTIEEDNMGTLALTIPGLTIENGRYAIAGRGMILHEKEDDFGQPTGNAGGRIGCGIIGITEVE